MTIQIKRVLAALLDFAYIHFISLLASFLGMYRDFDDAPTTILLYMFICGILFVFRDCVFKNASIGKKILKLKIVSETPDRLNAMTYILRAIPLILLPIELLMLLKHNYRTGDRLSKTWIEEDC